MMHHIERTSPKGEPFVGTCHLCGKSNLKMSAALDECENVRGLSEDEAMVESVVGPDQSNYGR